MNKEIVIRPVKPEDAESYTNLHNLVWRATYKDIFPEEVFVDKESKKQKMIEVFPLFARNDNTRMVYVAETGGEIVGFIAGVINANPPHFSEQNFAELEGIYIHPNFQGVGLGTKFKNIFEKWVRENGASKYVIGVLKDNHKARKVYEKWGGQLDTYNQPFVKLGKEYEEVYYTCEIKKDNEKEM